MAGIDWFSMTLLCLGIAILLGLVAYFRGSLEMVLNGGVSVLYRPIQQIQLQIARFLRSIYDWLRGQVASN